MRPARGETSQDHEAVTEPDPLTGAADTVPMTVEGGGATPITNPDPAPVDTTAQRVAVQERMAELVDRESLAKFRKRLISTCRLGAVVWTLFMPVDVLYILNGASPAWLIAAGRLTPLAFLGFMWLDLRSRRDASRARMQTYEAILFTLGIVGSVLIHSTSGGFVSPRLSANALLLMAHAVMLGTHWRQSRLVIGLMVAAVPLTLLTRALFEPSMAEQLGDLPTMLLFGQHMMVIVVAALISLWGGQLVFSLRQEVAAAKSIGRYRLRRRIAKGGMGEIWAAYHGGLGRDVALKMIQPALGSDEVAVERFEREVRMLAELTHPNTIRVFDYGATEAGVLYYAMELLEADDLQSLIVGEGALAPARAARLVSQCADALGEAHVRGIIHRDLKPANVLVVRSVGVAEFAKLIDFGIATEGAGKSGLTRTGMVVGTPGFIAPEVITGGDATARSDVYSLGMVLYVALTGQIPWSSETPGEMVREALDKELSPPSSVRPEVPDVLDGIVMRCLSRDPAVRFADGGELAEALRRARDTLPAGA